MPLASEIIPAPKGDPPWTEAELHTTCPDCNRSTRLDEAIVDTADPLETIYRCRACNGTVVIVSTPGVMAWEGRGTRLGDWMLRNPKNLLLVRYAQTVLLPACPHALD